MSWQQQLQELRAAGFSESEIAEHAREEREKMLAAGFSEQEATAWFGGDRTVPESPGFAKRLVDGLSSTAAAMWEGAKEGFGKDPIGIDPGGDAEKWLQNQGVFGDPATGRGGPVKLMNEAILRPTAALGELAVRSLAALGGAAEAGGFEATRQTALALGEDEGMANRAGRDTVAFLTATMVATGVPITRVRRARGGPKVEVIGRMPEAQDFDDAVVALTGGPQPALRQRLEDLWVNQGIHPAEAARDASEDIIFYQELMSAAPRRRAQSATPPAAETPPVSLGDAAADAALERVKAKIKTAPEDGKKRLSFSSLYTQFIDDLNPINKAVREAVGKGGLPMADDPYILARLTRGTFGKADHFLEFATYDFKTLDNTGKSLRAVLSPVEGDLEGFRAFVVAKRAQELRARGIESGIDAADAAAVVKAGKKYEPVMQELVAYQNELTRHLRDAGILSDDAYKAMLDANKNYVPFFRVMDDGAGGGGVGIGQRGAIRDPIKNIKGSERDIIDPLESVIKNTYVYISLAERNNAMRAFVDMAENSGNPGAFLKKVAPNIRATRVTEPEMRKFLQANGIDAVPDDLLTVFRHARRPLADNEIAVFRNGKREVFEVDPEIAAAFKAVDAQTGGILAKILAVPAKTLRAGSILSPEFIARNLIRDQSNAFVLSKFGYIPMLDLVRGAVSIAKKDVDFQNWLKSGGANSALNAMDRRYIQAKLFELNKDTGLAERALNVLKSPLEVLRATSELVENATRVGEFRRATRGSAGKEDILRGGFSSREVTLDFGRVGAQMRAANMVVAFLNPRVQGLDRIVREFAEHPLRASTKLGASVTLPSILLWAVNHDDPRYKELPQWQKDLFWIIITDDTIYRIPKPHELGVVFGSLPERILDAWAADNPGAVKEFASVFLGNAVPDVVPTFLTPLIDQFANRSNFTGNPIIPRDRENMLPEYQYTPYTTELSKALGKLFGAFPGVKEASIDQKSYFGPLARAISSPVLLENYLRAWTGGLGTYALKLADGALRKSGVLPDPIMPAKTLADIPLVKAFVVRYPSATAESIQRFYDRFDKKATVWNTVNAMLKDGNIDAVERELNFDPSSVAQMTSIRDALTQHSQLIRMIVKDPKTPAEEKRQLIDTLYFSMIELGKAGNELLDAVEKATAPGVAR